MNISEIFVVIEWVSALLLFIFSVFVITLRRGNKLMRAFLASFLLARSLMLVGFSVWNFDLYKKLPDLILMPTPLLFLYCPLLYLYTRSVTQADYHFRKIEFLHFTPALFILIWDFSTFHIFPRDVKVNMLLSGATYYPVVSWSIWMWIQLIIYGSLSLLLLFRFRNDFRYKNLPQQRGIIVWLTCLILAFLIWKAIFLTFYLAFLFSKESHVYFQIFVEVTFLFYAALIMYKSLQFPGIFDSNNQARYKTSPLTGAEKVRYRLIIENYMKEKKPFLDPAFNLRSLSSWTSIPEHHLSQVFSEELRTRFSEFVNRCRINEAIRLMVDSGTFERNITEIMYEAGFNSKSVFNAAFKKYTLMTPKEFRNKQQPLAV
jgi:AraC-like DNA-binding protein